MRPAKPCRRVILALGLIVVVLGCSSNAPEPSVDPLTVVTRPDSSSEPTDQAASTTLAASKPFSGDATLYRVDVLERLAHDPTAFTQGLVTTADGFFESTGLHGSSQLRELDRNGEVVRLAPVDAEFFAEGLELHDERLVQLTWRAERAFVYDEDTFDIVDTYTYDGEGWGLCSDGSRFVMSNGSSRLTFRDLDSFEEIGGVDVTINGTAQDQLNELECVNDRVYANVWLTDAIVRIDPASGAVDQVIDASGLLTAEEQAQANVLNGISAADSGEFFITGKLWPALFRVRFVPA